MSEKETLMWRGRDVRELSREELITALEQLYSLYQLTVRGHESVKEMYELAEKAKKRLVASL